MLILIYRKSLFYNTRLGTVSLPNDSHFRSLTSCVILCKFLNLSVPQFPPLYNGDNNCTYFNGISENSVDNMGKDMAQDRCSKKDSYYNH